ncbi:Actin-binding LIM protein 3 [Larimichthys crocea]|uniref:Actin-binding LIM protein 3 n=1 Tax=Larimichthys crocea TaxID=215358 RepID=A0A6G0I7R2_LARCR|nr:Actin-binding LIM protein 3 [Larimichthys crocea]
MVIFWTISSWWLCPGSKPYMASNSPDIIPYEANHAHTHLADDTLERYSCQSLGSLSPYTHDLLDGVELRTRRYSSSVFTDSPAHSRHGGSPLHCYLPATEETNIYKKAPIYKRQDISASPTASKIKTNENLVNSSCLSTSNCNSLYHPESNYYPYTGSPKVSRVRRFSSGGEEDAWNHNLNRGIGRLILKEEMKARSGCHDNDQWGSRRSSRCSSKEGLNNLGFSSLSGSPRSIYSADSNSFIAKSASLPGYGRNGLNRPGCAGADQFHYDSSNAVNWQIRGKPIVRPVLPQFFFIFS